MLAAAFESAIPGREMSQDHALGDTAIGIYRPIYMYINIYFL
jgi:hypothetical protein